MKTSDRRLNGLRAASRKLLDVIQQFQLTDADIDAIHDARAAIVVAGIELYEIGYNDAVNEMGSKLAEAERKLSAT